MSWQLTKWKEFQAFGLRELPVLQDGKFRSKWKDAHHSGPDSTPLPRPFRVLTGNGAVALSGKSWRDSLQGNRDPKSEQRSAESETCPVFTQTLQPYHLHRNVGLYSYSAN